MFVRFTFWGYTSKISPSEVHGVFRLYVILTILQSSKNTSYGDPIGKPNLFL